MPTPQNLAYRAPAGGLLPRWLGPVLLVVTVTAAGTLNTGARAEDSILTWIVKSVSSDEDGDIIAASAMRTPQVGSALTTGQQISTGGGQHMVLVNGRDLVEVSPNTTFSIGDNNAATADANIDLVSGAIHVEVGKRTAGQTFSIGAPYLVATVKGTKFDVSASSVASAVSVTEGVVAVSAGLTGDSVDVTAGNTASVSRRSPGAPTLAPTRASGAPSTIGDDDDLKSASAKTGSNGDGGGGGGSSGGGDSGGGSSGGGDSGGGDSGGGGSGGGDSGGGDSGGSDSGGSSSGGGSGSDIGGAVGGAVSGVSGAVGGAVSGVSGAVGGAIGGSVGGAISGVGGAVGGAVGGVGGAVGGALGGLGGNK
jgi:FecR protein